METLLAEGHMHLNTFRYFREIEDGLVRGDRYEGASEIQRGTEGSITTSDGKDLGASMKSWKFGIFPPNDSATNLFSIFILTPLNYPMTERVLSFGKTAFVVRRPDEFLARIKSALKYQGVSGTGVKVEYVSDDFTGKVGPFQKRKSFEWQSEWRLKINGGSGQPRAITLGNLNDIAFVCETSEVNEQSIVTKPGEQE